MHRMARHRLIILLGLTSLVATMVTITRYSSSLSQTTGARLMISQQKLLEYQHRLRLIASDNNSNQTINNLLDNLVNMSYNKLVPGQTSSNLVNDSDNINNETNVPVLNEQQSQQQLNSDLANNIPVIPSSSMSSIVPRSSSLQPYMPLILESGVEDNIPSLIISNNKIFYNKLLSNPTAHAVTKGPSQAAVLVTEKPTMRNNIKANKNNHDATKNEINIDVDPQTITKPVIGTKSIDMTNMNINEKQQLMDSLENNEPDKKLSKIKFKPKLVFDSEDLATTKHMLIDKPLGCDDDQGASLDLLVVVNSAVDHWAAREAIRDTWGKFAVERGAYVLYLLGSSPNPAVQRRVLLEDQRNSDILQGQYLDNYFNLTLKTISLMKWLTDRCSKVKYVLKVDDDMFVNMQHITDFSETRNFNKCIIGKLAKNWKPHRNTNNKWYVPALAFNGSTFPTFATGPAYMISGDAARPLYETAIQGRPMYLEDVYMTGIVAERAGIRRLNHAMFRNTHVTNLDECVFGRIMTSHKHTPQQIRQLWSLVYRQPPKICSTPAPKTVKPSLGTHNNLGVNHFINKTVLLNNLTTINKNTTRPQTMPIG